MTTQWVVVRDDVCTNCWTYDHQPVLIGPFGSYEEATASIDRYDDELLAVSRETP
jgi:hypothetical protein